MRKVTARTDNGSEHQRRSSAFLEKEGRQSDADAHA